MDEKTIRAKIAEAMAEPSAPQALIEKTVNRVNAICSGRAAEAAIRENGNHLPADELQVLTARSVVGRLMQSAAPPEGVTGEMMTRQLLKQPDFRMLTEEPVSALLNDLSSGKALQKLGRRATERSDAPTRPSAEKGPRESGGPTFHL